MRGSGGCGDTGLGLQRGALGSRAAPALGGTRPHTSIAARRGEGLGDEAAQSSDHLTAPYGSTEPSERSVDSDSEPEDGGQLRKQESETSTDEAPFYEEGSEGQRSRTCSTGQSDTEGSALRCAAGEHSDPEEEPEGDATTAAQQ